jgi:predicted Zn-dependent protease
VDLLAKGMQEQVERNFTVLQHKLVNRYINSMGQSIVSRNPQMPPLPYQFKVLRESTVNAFSLPGGTVYLTLGMISSLAFEGQVAAAIAHELAHQDSGHALILWRERIDGASQWLNSPKASARSEFERLYFSEDGLFYYGENYEREADEIALILLYQAGYDPRAYLSFLEAIAKINEKNPRLTKLYFAVHPSVESRINRTREYLKLLPPRQDSRLTSSNFKEVKHLLKLADKMKEGANKTPSISNEKQN